MQRTEGRSHGVYKHYLLSVLTVVLLFNYVDRVALGLLLQDVKIDLQLTDTQLGFLTGLAFALFYSVMGIPIARWADRGNRVTIISITVALWSAMVSLCGMAGSFLQLLLIRVGVAVGEAGCIPPAFSLIADYFSRSERPRATAIYQLGGGLSVVVGYLLAGWANTHYGWRVTFMLLGAPGLALAALAWFTLREPRRMNAAQMAEFLPSHASAPSAAETPSLKVIYGILWSSRTFRHLLFCISVQSFFNVGIGQWLPTFFIRSYGFTSGEIAPWFAAIYGFAGLAGAYLGGHLLSRHAANNERLQLVMITFAIVSAGVLLILVYFSPTPYVAFGLLALVAIGLNTSNGPLFATIQTLVPERMRAVSLAIVYLFANLIGMGLGPLVAGVLSDAFRPWVGEESLRYALLSLSPGYFLFAWHVWRASRTVTRDLEEASHAIG
jgi:MFS family permease